MDKQYLNKKQLEKRIERLNNWLTQNPNDPMAGTAKNESFYYINLLSELEKSFSPTILFASSRTEVSGRTRSRLPMAMDQRFSGR